MFAFGKPHQSSLVFAGKAFSILVTDDALRDLGQKSSLRVKGSRVRVLVHYA